MRTQFFAALVVFAPLTLLRGPAAAEPICPKLEWYLTATNTARVALAPDGSIYSVGMGVAPFPGVFFWPLEIRQFDRSGRQKFFHSRGEPDINSPRTSVTGAAVGKSGELYFATQTTWWLGSHLYYSSEVERFPSSIMARFEISRDIPIGFESLFVEPDGGLTYVAVQNVLKSVVHHDSSGSLSFSFLALGRYPVLDLQGNYVLGNRRTNGIHLARQARTGLVLWEKIFGSGSLGPPQVACAPDGIYVAGWRPAGETVLDSFTLTGPEGAYLLKTDLSGKALWARAAPDIEVWTLQADPTGGFFVGGRFRSSSGRAGPMVHQFDRDGGLMWDGSGSGSSDDFVDQMIVTWDRVILAGRLAGAGEIACTNLNFPNGASHFIASLALEREPSLSYLRISGSSDRLDAGSPFRLDAGFLGSPPVRFQWFKVGAVIPSETSAYLVKATSIPSDSGLYTVVASNAAGSLTSEPFSLTVLPPLAPILLSIRRDGLQAILSWSDPRFVLQSSTSVSGVFREVLSGTHGSTNTFSEDQEFFRLRSK